MAFDGIAAVQARIAEIESQVSPASAPGGSSTDSTSATQFASLLADAMNQNADAATDPLGTSSDSTGATTGGLDLSTLLSQLAGNGTSALGGLGATGATSGGINLSTLISQLTGNTMNAAGGLGSTSGLSGLSLLNQLSAPANSTGPIVSSPKAEQFLADALAQRGKKYVYGASPSPSNDNPTAFDCQGLVHWAAAREGITMPSGATAQYLHIRDAGTTMTVQQALHTPGALLFHFGHEPKNLGDIPADGHVAISVGDGVHTIEARGHAYGTNVFDNAAGRDFNFAGMIPGM